MSNLGAKQRWKYRMVPRSFTGMMTPGGQQVWDRERHTIWACWVSSVSTTHMWDFNLHDIDEYPILVGLPAGDLLGECVGHSWRKGWTSWTTPSEFLEPILRGQRRSHCSTVRVMKLPDIQEIVKYKYSLQCQALCQSPGMGVPQD